jgi:hypothetical protein
LIYKNGVKVVGQFRDSRFDSGTLIGIDPVGEVRVEDGRGNYAIIDLPDDNTACTIHGIYALLHYANGGVFYGRVDDEGEPGGCSELPAPRFVPSGHGLYVKPDGTALLGDFSPPRASATSAGPAAEAAAPDLGMQGEGQVFAPQGTSYVGKFTDGLPDGEGVCNSSGAVSLCQMKRGQDVTESVIAEAAAKAREQAAIASVDERFFHDAKAAADEAESAHLSVQSVSDDLSELKGPSAHDKCHCAFHPCLALKDASEKYDNLAGWSTEYICDHYSADYCAWATKREKAQAEYKAECRRHWAKWLNLSPEELAAENDRLEKRRNELVNRWMAAQAKAAQEKAKADARQAELDAARKQILADEKAMQRFYEQEEARIRAERARKLEERREKCKSTPDSCNCAIFHAKPHPPRDTDHMGACPA